MNSLSDVKPLGIVILKGFLCVSHTFSRKMIVPTLSFVGGVGEKGR